MCNKKNGQPGPSNQILDNDEAKKVMKRRRSAQYREKTRNYEEELKKTRDHLATEVTQAKKAIDLLEAQNEGLEAERSSLLKRLLRIIGFSTPPSGQATDINASPSGQGSAPKQGRL